MKSLKFKTNINCTGCLSKVSPLLNAKEQIKKWKVDLESEDRLLTIKTENMDPEEVKIALAKVGFKAEKVSEYVN